MMQAFIVLQLSQRVNYDPVTKNKVVFHIPKKTIIKEYSLKTMNRFLFDACSQYIYWRFLYNNIELEKYFFEYGYCLRPYHPEHTRSHLNMATAGYSHTVHQTVYR